MNIREFAPKQAKEHVDRSNFVITIDGSTTAGKRLMAERLAERYDLTVLNTGTSIRALALLAIENKLVNTDETNVTSIPSDFTERVLSLYEAMPQKLTITKPRKDERNARVLLGTRDMRGELLTFRKTKAIDNLSSVIAASPAIRAKLYEHWREAVRELGGVVVIGRKTGIDLIPDAQVKLYLFASPEASAVYRVVHDPTALLTPTTEERYIRERDGKDRERGLLDRPADALVIDTSDYIKRNAKGLTDLEQRIGKYIDSKYVIS